MMTQVGCWNFKEMYGGRWNLDFKIKPGDKVLDIGSGPNPFPYATHLMDMVTGNANPEKYASKIKVPPGKTFIDGTAEDLSMFKDKEFDFIYMGHVIEHIPNLTKALSEIARVGKRGFILTPAFEWEYLFKTEDEGHLWYFSYINDVLHGRRREKYEHDDSLAELMGKKVIWGVPGLAPYFESHKCLGMRFVWEIRFFWEGQIDFQYDDNLFPQGKKIQKIREEYAKSI